MLNFLIFCMETGKFELSQHFCNIFCRYGMLNGLIDSREVRRQKGASSSQDMGGAISRQDAQIARLREEVAQRDAYYAEYVVAQQARYTTILAEKLQVSMNNYLS
jgi:hypothetical protein